MADSTGTKSVTLHDVAREAGVSPITASRALSNPGLVSAKTIERVRQAVEATGYIPNLLAGGLKSRRSLTVAALVPNIAVAQFLPTVKALTDALDAAGVTAGIVPGAAPAGAVRLSWRAPDVTKP